jgi:hypothetical protein
MSDMGKVDSDLVGSAGPRFGCDESERVSIPR